LYEEIGSVAEQRARLLAQSQLVADISREAARALEIEPFLESLFSRLVAVFQERGVKVQPSLASYDAKTASLITYPTRFYDTKIRPTQVSIKKKGIMSWVAHYRKPYYAPDVTLPKHSKHYNPLLPDTRSEIAVPVFYDNDLLGVLDLESPAVDAFTSADLELLRTLTNHIAVNLHNIQQVDEIERTKGLVASRTAVALLGLASAESRHQLIAEARSASTHLKLLRDDVSDNRSPQDINRRIQEMEQILEQITKAPLVVALSPTEGVVPMLIGQYLQQRVDRLSKRERYKDIDLKCSSQIDNSVTVSLNPYWLDRLLDLLLKNAASAISAQTDRRILVTVQLSPDNVEVAIADNGPGIPEHLVPLLFRTQIRPDQGANGSGVGLLLAQTIVQTYGGDIYLATNSSAGVTMAFCLPQAQ
jgi:signal transduction histidine kinase